MSIKGHDDSVVSALPVIGGLLWLFGFHTANAGAPGDACALLTAAEVSSALGAAVGPGEPLLPNHTTACTWHELGAPQGTERSVSVQLVTVKAFEIGQSATTATGITKTPVGGLGEAAYFVEARGLVAGLSVRKGDTCFQVRARSNPAWFKSGKTPDSAQKDQAVDRALALEILKKL